MKPAQKNRARIHFWAGLSGYVASLAQATLCAEYGLPNEIHDSHASYIHHWMKLCSPRHNFINREVTIM